MNPHLLARIFPGASASTLAANAADFGTGKPEPAKGSLQHAPGLHCDRCAKIPIFEGEGGTCGCGGTFRMVEGPSAKPPSVPAVPVAKEASKRKPDELSKPRARKGMNGVETAYSLILEAKARALEIKRYDREGLTLRWPDGMTYSPDFTVWNWNVSGAEPADGPYQITFIETKGPHIRADALVKFRAARANWPEFEFQMWQRKSKREPFTQIL